MSSRKVDVTKLKFIQLVDRLEAGQQKEFGAKQPLLLEPYIRKLSIPTLSMEAIRPHRFQEVNTLITAMLLEHDLYTNKQIESLDLLRKVTFGGTHTNAFAIDGLRKKLPDFSEVRTISVDTKNIVIPLSFYINFRRIRDHLENEGFSIVEAKDRKGRDVLEATSPEGGKITISHMMLTFNHSICEKNPDEFEEGLTRFVELVCMLPFERKNWSLGGNTVYLDELRPIFDMMFKLENNVLGDLFRNVAGMALDKKIEESDYFKETKRSEVLRNGGARGDDEKAYSLDKEYVPDHINFIVVKENKEMTPTIVIDLDCHLNVSEIEAELRKLEKDKLFITTLKDKKGSRRGFVNKGDHIEIRKSFQNSRQTVVIDEERNLIATLKMPGTMFISLNKQTIGSVAKLLDIIYDKMLFYTPKIRDSEMGDSRLTPLEREVVNAFDSLMEIYRYFLEVDHYKKAFNLAVETGNTNMKIPSPREWILERMEESGRKDFPGRVLHVLKQMDREIKPSDFGKFGNAPDTVKHVNELYSTLQLLKGRFEAICEVTPEVE